MNNTTPAPFVQETFSKECDGIANAISSEYGTGVTDNGFFIISSGLPGFKQTGMPESHPVLMNFGTRTKPRKVVKEVTYINGRIKAPDPDTDQYCPYCMSLLHGNGDTACTLNHLPIGGAYTKLVVSRHRLNCPGKDCIYNYTDPIEFKEDGHLITKALCNYIRELLSFGFTLKETALVSGANQNIVKDIDKKRLQEIYTENGEGNILKKPERQARHLGIDEFKLHNGRKYATVIIDLDTGHVLFLAHTKSKQVVYDFMEFVGEEWMKGVEAVASDMNADYGKAFRERYPHIRVVYDYFHIVQNLNQKVINEVKKDEVKRLTTEGNQEAADALKGSKYVLMSGRETLQKKDEDAKNHKILSAAGVLFNKPEVMQKGGNLEYYQELISQNELLFTADLVKEKLKHAYQADTELKMKRRINSVIKLCEGTQNKHFLWFAKLLRNPLILDLMYSLNMILYLVNAGGLGL